MAASVLLVSDQKAGRAPGVCVLTGVATPHDVRLVATTWRGPRWLLAVPGFAGLVPLFTKRQRFFVRLPVSSRVWSMWRRRQTAAVAGMVFGTTLLGAGLIQSSGRLIGFGAAIALGAVVYRTRAVLNYWVTCRFKPSAGTIIVQPTHPAFDDAAKRLFIASLG